MGECGKYAMDIVHRLIRILRSGFAHSIEVKCLFAVGHKVVVCDHACFDLSCSSAAEI